MWTRILEIDLTHKSFRILEEEELFHQAMGGTAAATHLLERYCDPSGDPLGPDNPVILAIGPFSNILPIATKTTALFKSPHTGELGETHAGGRFAMAIYNAGFSALVIRGAAREPVVLDIDDDQVIFRSARSLWGQSASATERILRARDWAQPGKKSILRIGPAGERLSTYACATVDTQRHFGRLGLGAVLGSKKLKALVIGGTKYQKITDKKRFKELYDGIYESVVSSGVMSKYHDLGTAGNILKLNQNLGLPTRNFNQPWFEGADKISGEVFGDRYLSRQIACAHCQCGCIHLATLREQFHEDHGFKTLQVSYDFELIYALGSNLSIDSPDDILRLLNKTEKEGWDAISLGVTLAWATEAFLSGLINTTQTNDIIFHFGDADTYLKVLDQMARQTNDFYRDLEKGAAFCAARYGGRDLAITFGGNEGPGYMTGENTITDWIMGPRHSHLDGAGYALDLETLTNDLTIEEQTKKLVNETRLRMLLNSLVICLFARSVYQEDIILEGLNLLWRPCSSADLETFKRETLQQKYAFKMKCGWQPDLIEVPGKLTRVISSTGKVDVESIKKRAAMYWQEVGLQQGGQF